MFNAFVQALTSKPGSSKTRYTPRSSDPMHNFHHIPTDLEHRKYNDHLSMAMTNVQEPAQNKKMAGKNTGFPEPLCEDRNTTLPHPEANTSKNAAIESHDVPSRQANPRHTSFFSRHHSHHKDIPEEECISPGQHEHDYDMYAHIEYADGSKHEKPTEHNSMKPTEEKTESRVDAPVVEDVLLNGTESRDDINEEKKKGKLRKSNTHKG